MIDYIQNDTVIESFPSYPKVHVIDGKQHRIRDLVQAGHDVQSLGFFERTRQASTATDLQKVTGHDVQVIDGKPVEVPIIENLSLEDAKQVRIEQVKQEGLSRIQAVLPGVKDFDTLMLVAELWGSIKATAKSTTPTFQTAVDIYVAGEKAIQAVKDFTTFQQVADSDAVTDPNWP